MTVATITVPSLPAARAARDAGMAATESRAAAEQDRLVIDNVINHLADAGEPFSVNEARELLPAVSGPLIGARFHAAASRGQIERVGSTLATHELGHARRVSTWVKAGTNPEPTCEANGKQVASRHDVSNAVANAVTPEYEATIRRAHWALQERGGVRSTGDARKVIRDLLNVLGAITGVNGSTDELF